MIVSVLEGVSQTLTCPQMCNMRERAHLQKNFQPAGSAETLLAHTYYLNNVDDMFRRTYEVKS